MKKTARGLVIGALVGSLAGCVLVALRQVPIAGVEILVESTVGRAILLLAAIGAGGLPGGIVGACWQRAIPGRAPALVARRSLRARTAHPLAS